MAHSTLVRTSLFFAPLLFLPFFAFADDAPASTLETVITLGYYLSAFGFLIATVMMTFAAQQFGNSTFGEIFSYFVVGTGTFFVVTVFQTLGSDFFSISDESMDVWWHIMFFLAMYSYYKGLKALSALGSDNPGTAGVPLSAALNARPGRMWGMAVVSVLVVIFLVPRFVEPLVLAYLDSWLGHFGFHHFLAFLIAGVVGWYLFRARRGLGPIGVAIAGPMLLTIWALSLQHFWELQFESWKTIDVSHEVGEGGERIFLVLAGIGITYAAWRLRTFSTR